MKKGENTRQRIIKEAALILNQKGIAGTSISDIMKATSLAKGGIYRQFENKEEIVLEAFNFLSKRLATALNDVVKNKITAKDKLFAVLDLYYDRLVLVDNGGCPLLNFGTETDDTDPIISSRVGLAIKSIQDTFGQMVLDGIAAGEFKPGIDAHLFGIRMFNTLEGSILTSRVLHNKEQMKMIVNMFKNEIEAFLL
jgi:TetR/AcrR family transcriptional repressor of nem operon